MSGFWSRVRARKIFLTVGRHFRCHRLSIGHLVVFLWETSAREQLSCAGFGRTLLIRWSGQGNLQFSMKKERSESSKNVDFTGGSRISFMLFGINRVGC